MTHGSLTHLYSAAGIDQVSWFFLFYITRLKPHMLRVQEHFVGIQVLHGSSLFSAPAAGDQVADGGGSRSTADPTS